jgi:hypothetical protein
MLMGFVALAKGLDVFLLRDVATGGRMIPSCNLSFGKITFWIALAVDPCDQGGKFTLAEHLHDWESGLCPFLNCTLAFASQLRKVT